MMLMGEGNLGCDANFLIILILCAQSQFSDSVYTQDHTLVKNGVLILMACSVPPKKFL